MAFAPTQQQAAFLTALTTTSSHLALVARAGCGKTSTILLGVDELVRKNPYGEYLVCAFNKSIADEVGAKLKERGHTNWKQVQASTLHSMGYDRVRFVFKPREITDKKVTRLVEARNEPIFHQYPSQIIDLVSYAKQEGFGFFPDRAIGNTAAWHEMADHYDVNGLDDTSESDAVVEAAQTIYRASLAQTDVIDYDDMILFPLVKNLKVRFGKDVIFLDEAQDLSRVRQALAMKFLKPGGRMVIVGDDRQAIYGFTGADAAALPNLISRLGAKVMPLSITWRCPKSVVAVAQTYVPDIEAAPEAPEGVVRYISNHAREGAPQGDWEKLITELEPTDAVLCRNMAPLVDIALGFIRRGIGAKVEGRNIGEGLIALARRWKVKELSTYLNRLRDYQDREVQKAMAKQNEEKAQQVEDRCETLRVLTQACQAEGQQTVADLVRRIESLFADDVKGVITLATYHRSKGREWPRVVLWEHSQRCPSRAAKQEWQLQQEDNLAYVAVTRAQRELIWVEA